ncbi:MAG: hypothetical protein WA830_21920 [Candidatus Sulfotelmatobacter sp.]
MLHITKTENPAPPVEFRDIADIYANAAGQSDYFEAIRKAARSFPSG